MTEINIKHILSTPTFNTFNDLKNVNKSVPTVLIFYSNGCGHCHALIEYISKKKLIEKYSTLNFIAIEINADKSYDGLDPDTVENVKHFLEENSEGVPTILILVNDEIVKKMEGFDEDEPQTFDKMLSSYVP